MQTLQIYVRGDRCWPDLSAFVVGELIGIARLPKGTESGASSVTIRLELPDGRTVLAQTTLALLNTALLAFNAVEEDADSGTPLGPARIEGLLANLDHRATQMALYAAFAGDCLRELEILSPSVAERMRAQLETMFAPGEMKR